MTETLAPVPEVSQQSAALTDLASPVRDEAYADRLSDELLEHMIDCTMCLDDCLKAGESTCEIYRALQGQIRVHGGPTRGMSFGY